MIDNPFSIGPTQIRNRCILAPMSGVTDLPFRQLAWRYGAGLVVTEMIASRELVCSRSESWSRLKGAGIKPHMVQLAGREARWMGEAARIVEANGADIIDINMGCPAKKVTGGYSGSALMRDLDHALSLVEATVSAVALPVTLKMRLGWDENSVNAPTLAYRAEEAGVQMITVHGRTRNQFYEGKADWNAIARVRDATTLPLVANGDVESLEDVGAIMRMSGADAVMIGRAAQGRPWHIGALLDRGDIPRSTDDIVAVVAEHYDMTLEHYGQASGVRHFRKHLGWYLDRHANGCASDLRARIMTGSEPAAVIEYFRQAMSVRANGVDREAA